MRQAVRAPESPPPPAQNLGDQIRQNVTDAVAGALAPVRAEMRARLDEAREERQSLREHLADARSNSVRRDLSDQIKNLDAEIGKLETGLRQLESRLTTTDGPRGIASTAPPSLFPPPDPDSFNPAPMVISIMAILFIGFPLAITFARIMWRRASGATPPAAVIAETGRRFDRLEQSVDAIAIEIERISENQRYLTKVLSEPRQGALKD